MKKIITALFIIGASLSINAQDIRLLEKNGGLLNDDTLIFWHAVDTTVFQPAFENKKFVTVFNNSTDSMSIDLIREKIQGVNGTSDQLCWGTNCYVEPIGGLTIWQVNDPVAASAMDTAAGQIPLSIYIDAKKNVGEALFKYTFVDLLDSRKGAASIYVNFSLSYLTGLSDEEISKFGFTVYPNPTRNNATIKFKSELSFREQYIDVLDITGKLIETNMIPVGATSYTLETKSIASGVYFVRLIAEGVQVETKKIIVE
jgi:hypothetical protein